MRGKLLVGTAALVSLFALAACEEQNTTINEGSGDRVATAPGQPETTGVPGSATGPSVTGPVELDSDTRDYVQNAAMGDMFEIESSRLALQRSSSAEVKELAQHMVDEHQRTSDELKSRLVRVGLIVEMPTMLDDEHRNKLEELRSASNQEFDQKYIELQKEAHDEALELHRDYAMDGQMADLKAFASDTVPKIEMHHMMVVELENDTGKLSKN
jgi:putative membrane protein